MNLDVILLNTDGPFAQRISEWASNFGIEVGLYDSRSEDFPQGLLLINANQDIARDHLELHSLFDRKHIPTQKIDVNGTLQVAISSFQLWLKSNKVTRVLILGSDDLVANENLDRFLNKVS